MPVRVLNISTSMTMRQGNKRNRRNVHHQLITILVILQEDELKPHIVINHVSSIHNIDGVGHFAKLSNT